MKIRHDKDEEGIKRKIKEENYGNKNWFEEEKTAYES